MGCCNYVRIFNDYRIKQGYTFIERIFSLMIHDLIKKKLDNIAKELGAKVDYRSCEDEYSTWREITIEYDHDLKEKE